jgi:hypothetical protein
MEDATSEAFEYHPMDEVIPGLWIGDVAAAITPELLEEANIKFILSAMRGRIKINPVRSKPMPMHSSV